MLARATSCQDWTVSCTRLVEWSEWDERPGSRDLLSTMNELTNIIVQKTGISQENAQKAVQVTLGFLKTKLPAPLAGQLDSFLSANPVAVGAKV